MNVYEPDFDKNSLKAVDLAQQAEASKLAAHRGLQVREGVRRGWRAWIFVKGEEDEQHQYLVT